ILYRCGILTRNRKAPRPPTRSHYLQESAFRVTPLSQMMEAEPIRGRICSPTCVTMALSSLGRNYPTSFVAADCYDYGEKIYGNWAFNVASLWRLGARARLDFFANVEQACSELFGGRILIASIKFQDGSLSGAPIKKTNGHLVLLTGIRKNADGSWELMVNDPAADSPDGVTRLYDIVEFENAWAGVAYVVEGCR
ncbi:MAG: C39 family peptidase, partial [Spirochaetaceae bacterium]|nr:C39 family peptidase [Spirochaetaceae bacterium]